MKENYFQKTIKTYLKSFTRLKLLGIVFTLNLLLTMSVYLGFQITKLVLKTPLKNLGSVNLDNIAMKGVTELKSIASTMRAFYITLIVTIMIFSLFILLSFSLFEGMAWCRILKKRFTLKYLGKFILLNLIWFLSFIFISLFFLIGSKQNITKIVGLVITYIFLYFTILLFFFFTKENRLSQIKKALKIGIVKIHYFITPYALILITFFVIAQLKLSNVNHFFILFVYLLFFSWLQNYTKDVILEIQKV